jgi:hypothetical protein
MRHAAGVFQSVHLSTERSFRDGEQVEIDAIDFIRTLAGRLPGAGVLSNSLPL